MTRADCPAACVRAAVCSGYEVGVGGRVSFVCVLHPDRPAAAVVVL